MCRFSRGTPSYAVLCHTIFPLCRSIAITTQRCGVRSSDAVPSPYSPGLNVASGRLLIAEVTKMRSPDTIGLECASPGTAVVQTMFFPVETFQVSGGRRPSPTPEADGPRNPGQLAGVAAVPDAYSDGQCKARRRGSGSERSIHGHPALNRRTGATPARRR